MTDSPKPETSFIDEAVIRQTLRMKAEFLNLLALTVGVHNISNDDFDLMNTIDTHCRRLPGRYRQHSISGSPPLAQPGSGERFLRDHPSDEVERPLFNNAGAQDFASGIAEQLGTAVPANPFDLTGVAPATSAPAASRTEPLAAATANPAPPPPAAPTAQGIQDEPAGEIDEEVTRGLSEIAPENEDEGPSFDAQGVRNRGHIRLS